MLDLKSVVVVCASFVGGVAMPALASFMPSHALPSLAPPCATGCSAHTEITIYTKSNGQWVEAAEDATIEFDPVGGSPVESNGACECDEAVCKPKAIPTCYAGAKFKITYPGVDDYRESPTGFGGPYGPWTDTPTGYDFDHAESTCGEDNDVFYEFKSSSDVKILRIHVEFDCNPCDGTCP